MNAVRDWWQARAPRERRFLTVAGGIAGVLLVYLVVIEPLQERRDRLASGVAAQRELLAWMHAVVVPAGERPGRTVARREGSLFATVDRSARATAFAGSLQRVQPEGRDAVRVWLDGAPFDEVVRWLAMLEREQGIAVTALAVERAEGVGLVGARVTLGRTP